MTTSTPVDHVNLAPPAPEATLRVSKRDVRETSWRALVASGVSAGEAQLAAEAVAFGEIHFGVGVDSALRELTQGPKENSPVRFTGSDVRVIEGGTGRGLLSLAPLAVGTIAARPTTTAVLLVGFSWDPVLVGYFIKHCGDGAPSFFAFEHRGSTLVHGCRVDPDTSFTLYDDEQLQAISTLNSTLLSRLAEQPDGLVVVSDFGGFRAVDAAVSTSARTRRNREDEVFGRGMFVDSALWSELVDASQRYLAVVS